MIQRWTFVSLATLALVACSQETNIAPADEKAGPATTAATTSDAAPTQEQAVAAALPGDAAKAYAAHKLATAPYGTVLVSEVIMADLPDGHSTTGRLDAYYLAPEGSGWKVAQRHQKAVEVGSMGTVGEWSIANDYLDNPVVVASGGFTGQGFTEGCTVVTELTPEGPRLVAKVPDYAGTAETNTEGKIGSIQKGKSFVVTYAGEKPGTVTWTWQNDKYVASAPAPIESCGEG